MGDLNYKFNDTKIEFYADNEGLATSFEWWELSESIRFAGICQMMGKNLFTSLCLDSEHCSKMINGIGPIKSCFGEIYKIHWE